MSGFTDIDARCVGFDDSIGALTGDEEIVAVTTLGASELLFAEMMSLGGWTATVRTNNLGNSLHFGNFPIRGISNVTAASQSEIVVMAESFAMRSGAAIQLGNSERLADGQI